MRKFIFLIIFSVLFLVPSKTFAVSSFQDDFNRADGDLGGSYTPFTNNIKILGNEIWCQGGCGTIYPKFWTGNLDSPDITSSFEVTSSSVYFMLFNRCDGTNPTTTKCYKLTVETGGNSMSLKYGAVNSAGGDYDLLYKFIPLTNPGDVYSLTTYGSNPTTWLIKKNGNLMYSGSDTNPAQPTATGKQGFAIAFNDVSRLDNYSTGLYTPPPTPTPLPTATPTPEPPTPTPTETPLTVVKTNTFSTMGQAVASASGTAKSQFAGLLPTAGLLLITLAITMWLIRKFANLVSPGSTGQVIDGKYYKDKWAYRDSGNWKPGKFKNRPRKK